MSDDKEKGGVSLEIDPISVAVRAHVSHDTLNLPGRVAAWLFPEHDAKVRITRAAVTDLEQRILAGEDLAPQERALAAVLMGGAAGKLLNAQHVADRAEELLPQMQEQMKALRPASEGKTSPEFRTRVESIASDLTTEELRDLFARLIAGEVARPGTFSLRSLDAVRVMEPGTARAFETLRQFTVDGEIWRSSFPAGELPDWGLGFPELTDLQDAGLVDSVQVVQTFEPGEAGVWRLGPVEVSYENSTRPVVMRGLWRLTRTGRELGRALPSVAPRAAYVELLAKESLQTFGPGARIKWRSGSDDQWKDVVDSA